MTENNQGGTPGAGEGQTTTPTFAERLPEDLRAAPALQNYLKTENPEIELARGYVNASKLLGHDPAHVLRLPATSDPTDPAWGEIFNKIGRPEKAEGYTFDLGDDAKVSPEFLNWFREDAHKAGLTTAQANNLAKGYMAFSETMMNSMGEQVQAQQEQAVAALKTEWGGLYDKNLGLAKQAAAKLGGDEIVNLLNETGLGDNPVMVKFFHKLASYISEDQVGDKGTGAGGFNLTPDQAKAQQESLKQDKGFMDAYMKKEHPAHKEAVERMNRLFQQMHPEG